MKDRDRHDLLAADAERTDDTEQFDLRKSAAARRGRVEDVKECSPEIVQRDLVAEAGHRALLQHVEAAHVVEAHDVIGVAVRKDDGVDAPHAESQRLRSNIRPGINQQRASIVGLDVHRGAPAFVTGIGRATGGAVAADHRHAV